MKIKDIPEDNRPYERCLRNGPDTLTDEELLSIILRSGTPEFSSLETAGQILALSAPGEGLLGLLNLSLPDLTSVRGVGTVRAVQLLCIGEISRRIWKAKKFNESSRQFTDPASVAGYYREDMRHLGQEQMRVMMLNTKQVLLHEAMLTQGTVNASLVSPREIFIEALRCGAVNLIMVHNHPSGDPGPSREDIALTATVKKAGELIGIHLIDHVIIGDGVYVSFKEQGLL